MTEPYVPLKQDFIELIERDTLTTEIEHKLIQDRNYWKEQYEALLLDAKPCAEFRISYNKGDLWPRSEFSQSYKAAERIEAR